MRATALRTLCITLALWLIAGSAWAFDSLITRLPARSQLSTFFRDGTSRAEVKDGLLLGHGRERTTVLPDGRLQLRRSKTYTRLKHPETGKIVRLHKPWRASSTLVVSPQVRLIKAVTKLEFDASDPVMQDEEVKDAFERLFQWDEAVTRANAAGNRLTRVRNLRGAQVDREEYDYEADDVPLEIVGMVLSVAIKHRVDRFDFDLLVPGGSTHGVRSQVHRTRDLAPFVKGYPVPKRHRSSSQELAIVEMRLASPVKYVFFPHKFFMVYPSAEPEKLLAFWGGDPDEHLQAFRIEPEVTASR